MMTTVKPFPYDNLLKYTAEEASLLKRLFNAYYYLESKSDVIKGLLEPLQTILKTPVSIKITNVAMQRLKDIQASLSQNILFGLVNLEPRSHKAILFFETLLAKLMVYKVLSGKKDEEKKIMELQTKSLTVLEEAIVQYVIISIIENFTNKLQSKNFNIQYDGVFSDSAVLSRTFSKEEPFAVFSIQLQLLKRDFYIKLVLPFQLADDVGMTKTHEQILYNRLLQFGRFNIDFSVEVAHVTLEPSDIDQLSQGDIILFDESKIQMQNKHVKGMGELKVCDDEDGQGYLVDLDVKKDNIRAKIVSAL